MSRTARTPLAALCGILLAGLVLPACKSEPPPAPVEPPKPVEPKPVEPKPVEPEPVEPEPVEPVTLKPTLTEEAARAVFDRWLAAQNAGDFAAYEATYAPRFFGIKRAGPRTYRYDRAGWMKDRQRMFGKPMTVTAEDVRITPGPGTARILFTQTWASGNYRDTGPKQLVLGLHAKQALIAREEMLQSTVLGTAPVGGDVQPLRFVRMLDAPYVVLGDAVETEAPPRLLARGRPHVVSAALAGESPHVGRAVTLYGPNGRRCGGTVAEVVVLGMVIPHFGAIQTWNGEMDDSGEKASAAEIAASVWAMSSEGGRVLAGKLDRTANDCAGALYARLEGSEAPVAAVWRSTPVPPARQNAARDMLRLGVAWKAIQKDYEDIEGGQGPWDAAGIARTVVKGFTAPDGRELVVVDMNAGLGCGGFGGGLWQAFTVAEERVVPVGAPQTSPFVPSGALDRGDGLPALFGVEGYSGDSVLFTPQDGAYAPASRLAILDLDCPC